MVGKRIRVWRVERLANRHVPWDGVGIDAVADARGVFRDRVEIQWDAFDAAYGQVVRDEVFPRG